jgi:hypothetical protein
MTEKKRLYESDVIALPPLRLVLGEVPSPDPEQRRKPFRIQKPTDEMETNIKKLIAHLTENSK